MKNGIEEGWNWGRWWGRLTETIVFHFFLLYFTFALIISNLLLSFFPFSWPLFHFSWNLISDPFESFRRMVRLLSGSKNVIGDQRTLCIPFKFTSQLTQDQIWNDEFRFPGRGFLTNIWNYRNCFFHPSKYEKFLLFLNFALIKIESPSVACDPYKSLFYSFCSRSPSQVSSKVSRSHIFI